MIDLLLVAGQPRERFLGVLSGEWRPQEERVIVGPGNDQLGLVSRELFVFGQSKDLTWCRHYCQNSRRSYLKYAGERTFNLVGRNLARLIIGSRTNDEIRIERHGVDPMGVIRQSPDQLALVSYNVSSCHED